MKYIEGLKGHFKTVINHKKEVFKLCCIAGIRWQGIVHDLSKFSLTEMLESAKYYTGEKSPITLCKEDKGYSLAWFHHRGRNMHHPEYWVDKLAQGGVPVKMPYKYNVEMVCDMVAASKTYNGKNFTTAKPLEFWDNVSSPNTNIHEDSRLFVRIMLVNYKKYGEAALKPERTKKLFREIERKSAKPNK